MTVIDLWVPFATYLVMAGSPGPSNMAIMATAMSSGRRQALCLAAGVLTGSMTWGILAAAGVSSILMAYAGAIQILKIVGGAYLLFLAFKALRSAARPDTTAVVSAKKSSPRALYIRGALMHLTNPKAIVGWVSTIALGVHPDSAPGTALMIFVLCFLSSVCIFSSYAIVFSHPAMARLYRRSRRAVEAVLAAVLGLAGIRLLASAT